MKYIGGAKKVAKVVWYLKHEMTHVLLGIVLAWVLRELWGQFNTNQLYLAIFGSLAPDLDHLVFFFFYGRKDPYSIQVKKLLRQGSISSLASFIAIGHKENTNLWSHNIYSMGILGLGIVVCYSLDWKMGIVFLSSMVLHFIFDILDDLVVLGTVNPNWRRWGRPKKIKKLPDVST
jgi:hypothetical protein